MKKTDYDPLLSPPIPIRNSSPPTSKQNSAEIETSTKKAKLNVVDGGNLKKIHDFFHPSRNEIIIIHSANEEEENKEVASNQISGLIIFPDWREPRRYRDTMKQPEQLDDIAPEHERFLWDLDLIKNMTFFHLVITNFII